MSEANQAQSYSEQQITTAYMPPAVREYLDSELNSWTEEKWLADTPSLIHFEGSDSYVMPIHANIDARGGVGEEVVFVVDTDESGNKIGMGLLGFGVGDHPPALKKPYVAYTQTEQGRRQEGLGTRRLRLMNQLALRLFDQPLNSDPESDLSIEAMYTWQKLVRAGEAEGYEEENGALRWRFKTDLHR